jgi:HSP20 family protein
MSNLVRWNPIRDVLSMSEAMDRLFDQAFVYPGNGGFRAIGPAIDLIENGDNFVVKAELPGFNPDDVDISIEGNTLTLRANVQDESNKDEGEYHVRERRQNSFTRTLTLPVAVNADKANASYDNGILTLTLPKHETALPKKISITAKSSK